MLHLCIFTQPIYVALVYYLNSLYLCQEQTNFHLAECSLCFCENCIESGTVPREENWESYHFYIIIYYPYSCCSNCRKASHSTHCRARSTTTNFWGSTAWTAQMDSRGEEEGEAQKCWREKAHRWGESPSKTVDPSKIPSHNLTKFLHPRTLSFPPSTPKAHRWWLHCVGLQYFCMHLGRKTVLLNIVTPWRFFFIFFLEIWIWMLVWLSDRILGNGNHYPCTYP